MSYIYDDLKSKTVVISGASTGIGRAAANQFVAQGATVWNLDIAVDERELPNGASVPAGGVTSIRCDVRSEDAVHEAFTTIMERDGRVDVVFANAGITWAKTVTETPLSDLAGVIDVNLFGIYNVARTGFQLMKERGEGGSIILTSSPHATRTTADLSAYSISKAGVLALNNALAIEGGPLGIRVNVVSPGAVDTPILRKEARETGDEEGALRRWGATRPIGRVGRPDEIAAAVLFLASGASSFVVGSILVVDGGLTAYLGGDMSLQSTPREGDK